MKKQFTTAALLLLGSVLLVQCGKDCASETCPTPQAPVFGFRIVNSGGKDLLIGTDKLYDTSKVRVFAKKVSTGAEEDTKAYFYSLGDTIMIGVYAVNSAYSSYYLKINGTATDSMFFNYNVRKTECCDNSYYSFVRLNNTSVSPALTVPLATVYKLIK
mgnify:CR=1 FL=1